MMNLTLEREGQFTTVGMIENANRCGSTGGVTYRYEVRIEASDAQLSPEGYIIENSRIHQYFLNRYCTGTGFHAISCEQMAARAADAIGKRLMAENISVKSVTCTIHGSNMARLTALWERPKVAPQRRAKVKQSVTEGHSASN